MRKAAIEISSHEFFSNIPKLKNVRFAHRFYAAQMLTLTSDPESSVADFNRLKGAYEMYKNVFPSQFQKKTSRSLTLLRNLFGNKLHAIRSKSDLPILYLIAHKLLSTYSISGFEDRIGFFILDFINNVERHEEFNKLSKNPFVRYKFFKKYQYLHIQEKYVIMASELLKAIPDMKPLDQQRLFNDTEKLAIYLRANGKCEKCEEEISIGDGHADHRIRHTDGGLTTIANGRFLCIPCHNKIHGRKLIVK